MEVQAVVKEESNVVPFMTLNQKLIIQTKLIAKGE